MSRGGEEGVKRRSGRCEEEVRKVSRAGQEGIMSRSGRCQEEVRNVSRGSQEDVKGRLGRCHVGGSGSPIYLLHLLSTGVHVTLAPPADYSRQQERYV